MKLFFSLTAFIMVTSVSAQKITTGIYASPTSDASTYVELLDDGVLKTVWASKYPTNYNRIDDLNFKSENGDKIITIENNETYKISNVSGGTPTTLTLQLALPKLNTNDLEEITLPQGKAYITREIPINITGSYQFDGSANVITLLNPDGTGKFQYALDSDNAGTLFDVKWGILCNDSGQYLANSLKGIDAYTLMIYTTKWEAIGVQYNKVNGMIVINRDRFKQK